MVVICLLILNYNQCKIKFKEPKNIKIAVYKFNEILNPEIDKSEDSVINTKKTEGLSQSTWITILVILTSLSLLFWYSLS